MSILKEELQAQIEKDERYLAELDTLAPILGKDFVKEQKQKIEFIDVNPRLVKELSRNELDTILGY